MGYRFPKHLSLALLLGVLALMAGTTSHFYVHGQHPTSVDPQVTIEPHSDYQIESVSASKCLQFAGAPAFDGEAQIWTCDKSAAQRFRFDPQPDGYYRIRLAGSNKCLDVVDGSQDNGAAVKGVTWTGEAHQQWRVVGVGGGVVRLMTRHSEKALDIWEEKTTDGAVAKVMYWKGSSNQEFRLTAVARAER